MRRHRRGAAAIAVLTSLSLIAAACGDDEEPAATAPGTEGTTATTADDTTATTAPGDTTATTAPGDTTATTAPGDTTATTAPGDTTATTAPGDAAGDPCEASPMGEAAAEPEPGAGEIIDLGTFVGDPPEHLDPALNSTLDAYQVINAMYDGLTDIDTSDPASPEVVPHVAESFEPNEDATEWTFTIREGQQFSDGEAILPSTFACAWERASDPKFAGDYSYLMNFIEGGAEKLDGSADSLSGVAWDDEAMTLTVTMSAPYANFAAVAGFQLFFPMPKAAEKEGYENGIMVGNGPYMLESERSDEQIVVVRNEAWGGDFNQETWPDRVGRIEFNVSSDPETAYNAFEAGEGDTANIPPALAEQARADHGTTLDVEILGSYHFLFNDRVETIGGDDNKLFRQAISQAINREDINEAVYNGTRQVSTGITPNGIPGFKADLCDFCTFDKDAAQAAFDQWKADGGEQAEPLMIQFNADSGHEPVVQIIIDNLAAIGIEAEADPRDSETYFTELAEGACVMCRAGWYADYPTYDNFMYDLFHSETLDGNNYGFQNEEFDSLVDEAKETTDLAAAGELYNQAEEVLLNEQIMAVPINWYLGDYAYDQEKFSEFPQTNQGLLIWEQIALN
ncbi:MAG: ABC transporter substrate-binding protein [Actinomycetota bacterium]|nr:ABC transporter substrate-binding protein [Actinomycetota bacterium]